MKMEKFGHLNLLKFEPSQILLSNPISGQVYRYEEPTQQVPSSQPLANDPLFVAVRPLGPGFLYEKELSTLGKELRKRSSMSTKEYFDEVQICNTFAPIIDFIRKGKNYGTFCPEAILITQEGQIRLKHPILGKPQQTSFQGDLQQVGLMILGTALLKAPESVLGLASSKKELVAELGRVGLSVPFMASLWVMLFKVEELLPFVFNLSESPASQHWRLIISEIGCIQEEMRKVKVRELKIDLGSEQCRKPRLKLQVATKKKTICIPALNLNLRQRQQNSEGNVERKVEYSSKKRVSHNENLNEEVTSARARKEDKSKILDCRNLTNQIKGKKKSPQKKKGRTVDKRNCLKI